MQDTWSRKGINQTKENLMGNNKDSEKADGKDRNVKRN